MPRARDMHCVQLTGIHTADTVPRIAPSLHTRDLRSLRERRPDPRHRRDGLANEAVAAGVVRARE